MQDMIRNPKREDTGEYAAFAWPGGYPIVYLSRQYVEGIVNNHDKSEYTLCPTCTGDAENWKPHAAFVHYEGEPIVCEDCQAEIESAYGDPSEE